MKYQYKIIVGNKRNKAEFILKKEMNEATLGTISGCDFRLSREVYDMDFQIRFIYDNDKWNLQCSNDDLYAIKNNNKVLTAELSSGDGIEIYKVLSDEFFLGVKFVVDINKIEVSKETTTIKENSDKKDKTVKKSTKVKDKTKKVKKDKKPKKDKKDKKKDPIKNAGNPIMVLIIAACVVLGLTALRKQK